MSFRICRLLLATCAVALPLATLPAAETVKRIDTVLPRVASKKVETSDLFHLRSAADPQLSPDGTLALFTVQYADRVGAPYTRIWRADLRTGTVAPWGDGDGAEGSSPRWSPDGRSVAFRGSNGIILAKADGSGAATFVPVAGSNTPLPRGNTIFAWSPDGKKIAYVSATPSSEPEMESDPIIIDRYWFRPDRGWPARFTDNKRLHLFVADVATASVTQLTSGDRDHHSIDWAPDSRNLLYLSNPESKPDQTYNYDIYTIDILTKAKRRLTETRGVEYAASWSPNGQTIAFSGLMRPVTSSETNMEEPHVWTLDVATGARREVGAGIDSVQGRPQWSLDGRWLYFTVQSRGSVGLYRLPSQGGNAERIGPAPATRGSVTTFAIGRNGVVVAAMATPKDLAQLFVFRPGGGSPTPLTALNAELLGGKTIAETRAFTFKSYDDKEIEAFLTVPAGVDPDARGRHPMIVVIHGGPHGQQGPNFVHKTQVYAARGWASLMVNYRGSTGYGQAFTNAIARDQNGGEAMDVLAGVDAAIVLNPWIDATKLGVEGGSYGGQLTNWLVTQTPRFKAAIPWAGISNLVSHNYMSSYHDYLEQEYFGKPHTGGIMDMLWIRSPIRFVDRVKTPVMLSHGDNDLLVNVAEDEQFFIALKDVGVDTVMLRYPREGHGMRESQNIADFQTRSIAWYEKYFGN